MPRTIPPPLSVTLTSLRTAQGWTQKELAQAVGISKKLISFYERGRSALSREMLERMVAVMGLDSTAIDSHLASLQSIRAGAEGHDSPVGPTAGERRRIEMASAAAARVAVDRTRSEMTRAFQAPRIRRARQEAEELWSSLKGRPIQDQRARVDNEEKYWSWALCERLCAESERAAPADAGRAVELAGLALRIAGLVVVSDAWHSRLQGYAWAHLGNARRVAGDLPGSEEAFVRGRKLWESGATASPRLLDEGRVLDLEASLRRAQRRFREALMLHDQALAVTPAANQGYILLNKAAALEQSGDSGSAIEVLQQAAFRVDAQHELRLWFALRFQLAVNLCHLRQNIEAEALLPEVRRLATQLGNESDLVRVLWLEGRIAARLGRQEEAFRILSRVRQEFISRGIAYDAALASLELAVLYLEQGRLGDVKVLARQMTPIFQAQGVHREALAALRLFCQAAGNETVTVEMARHIVEYLHRARHDPNLHFQEIGNVS